VRLSVAYMTARRDCKVEWFRDSLCRQILPSDDIQIIVVDFFHAERKWSKLEGWLHVPPKPTVWQGPHRLTRNDYFAPSSARNTALCYAKHDHIAYVDDLSVLGPQWLSSVREAITGNYIACGAFQKVKHLNIQVGRVIEFMDFPQGHDHRFEKGSDKKAVACPPNWLFGCSVCLPVAALEKINGWPEAICDSTGVGAEDCFTGETLVRTGHAVKYDRRMFTYESEELHFQEPLMKRCDKGEIGKSNSKSWAAVRMMQECKRFDNNFDPFPDIAALRKHILAGGSFPIQKNPLHDWYDGQPLSEL